MATATQSGNKCRICGGRMGKSHHSRCQVRQERPREDHSGEVREMEKPVRQAEPFQYGSREQLRISGPPTIENWAYCRECGGIAWAEPCLKVQQTGVCEADFTCCQTASRFGLRMGGLAGQMKRAMVRTGWEARV